MRWKESREAKAKKVARRKWEARARTSLALRHEEYRHLRSRKLVQRKLREVAFRGLGLRKIEKRRMGRPVYR